MISTAARLPRIKNRSFWVVGASALALASAGHAAAQDAQQASDQAAPVGTSGTTTPSETATQQSPATTTGGSAGVSGNPVIDATAQPAQSTVTSADIASGQAAGNEIVVTGLRQSLANAQSIKRNADTVVDAISAEDIGALPDRSINEALQRVPGVTITRFAAPSDSAHFSVQGSGVTVRGLGGYELSEFNGRDTFGVSAGRGIGYNDVPSELAGSIEVYKNITPDMIEGGISGVISINTRKPFDQKGQVVYLSGGLNYGDLAKQATPSIVGLYSRQFDLPDGGRIGVLVGGSYDRLRTRADSVFTDSFLPRFNAPDDGVDGYNGPEVNGDYQGSQYDGILCDGNNPNEGRIVNAGKPYQIRTCDAFPVPAGFDTVYAPQGGGVRQQNFNVKRKSVEAGLQYENADRSLLVTASYLRADYYEHWYDHAMQTTTYYGDIGKTFPVAGTNYTFDDDGVFTGGTVQRTGGSPTHYVPSGCGFYDPPTNASPIVYGCPYPNFVNPNGLTTDYNDRSFTGKSLTQDAALNIKFEPTDRLHLQVDGQYVGSKASNVDDVIDLYTYSNVALDLSGKTPQVQFLSPGFDPSSYFGNPNNVFFNDAMNNRAKNNGHEWAFRGDAQYDLSDEGFFRALRVGARWAKRSQVVRTNDYSNWGSLSATWTDQGPRYLTVAPEGSISTFQFQNFFRGKESASLPSIPAIADTVLRDHDAFTALTRTVKDPSGQFSFIPLEDGATCAKADLVDTYFCPNQIYNNSEETKAAYVRLDFGTKEFGNGMKLSGNIGIRYVGTNDKSAGSINYPQPTQVIPAIYNGDFAAYCAESTKNSQGQIPGQAPSAVPALCAPGVTAAQQQAALAFANGGSVPEIANQKFHNWLPAFNVRLDLTPKLLMRFAASKAIVRPNFGDLRDYVSLGFNGSGGVFTARSANPYLRPTRSTQFDLTTEWYFAKVGSLTGTLFYKELKDVILQNSGLTRTFANNGVTQELGLTGPSNADGTGKVKGAELAYQQTYDFLPGLLSGFGTRATLTYITEKGLKISPPSFRATTDPTPNEGDGNQPPEDITGLYEGLGFPGLSKWNFNAEAFFDKAGFYARVAYSWRSKYLLTSQDCCFPFLPVYQTSSGQMDASLFYTINSHVKIGVQGSNLLDTTTKTVFRLNGDGLDAPRSFFKSDRQYLATARLTF